jgi:hypothetical protein
MDLEWYQASYTAFGKAASRHKEGEKAVWAITASRPFPRVSLLPGGAISTGCGPMTLGVCVCGGSGCDRMILGILFLSFVPRWGDGSRPLRNRASRAVIVRM